MTNPTLRTLAIAAALGLAPLAIVQPALAQPSPPSGPEAAPGMPGMGGGRGYMRQLFVNLSPEGQRAMRDAFRSQREDGTRQQIEAARAEMLDVLGAERLDVSALERAMLHERTLAQGQQQRMQAAMLGAFQKLSLGDRRTFVASARDARTRVEGIRAAMRAARTANAAPPQ